MTAKQKKIAIYVVVALVILALVYFLFIRNKGDLFEKVKKKKLSERTDLINEVKESDEFPLKHGSENKWVKKLQKFLKDEYGAEFPQYGVDGIWGNETQSQVKKYLNRDNVSKNLYLKKEIYKTKI